MKSLRIKYEDRDDLQPWEWLTIECARGCIFQCPYCNFPILGVREDHTRSANDFESEKGWEIIETYGWKVVHIRRVTQQRDKTWFESIQNDLVAFWNDVEGARNGTWIPPPPKVKRVKADPLQFIKDD